MIDRTTLTRQSTDLADTPTETRSRRAPGEIATINREWLGLRDLTYYAHVSERTIRSWIRSPVNPLPAVKVCGKVLVRRSDFDAFLQRYRIRPLEEINIDAIVQDVLKGDR